MAAKKAKGPPLLRTGAKAGLRVLVLSGPNLQLLGKREPEIYGRETLADIHERLVARGKELGAQVTARQSNHEGQLCDWIGEGGGAFEGILLNGAAFTHTSLALFDALKAVGNSLFVVEHEMDVVRRATEAVGAHGHRVSLVLKADIRPGRTGELDGKVARVEALLDD